MVPKNSLRTANNWSTSSTSESAKVKRVSSLPFSFSEFWSTNRGFSLLNHTNMRTLTMSRFYLLTDKIVSFSLVFCSLLLINPSHTISFAEQYFSVRGIVESSSNWKIPSLFQFWNSILRPNFSAPNDSSHVEQILRNKTVPRVTNKLR